MSTIPQYVLKVLSACSFEGNKLFLPDQLDRPTYTATNKVIVAAGGKWNRKAKAHVFDEDAADAMDTIILTGEYVDKKKEFQQFDTPKSVVKTMIGLAKMQPNLKILEPSAGTGNIVNGIFESEKSSEVYAVEIDPARVKILKESSFQDCKIEMVYEDDFLAIPPETFIGFDRILMNPPFTKGQDIAHIQHAANTLNRGGLLISVASSSVTFRQEKKYADFREWVAERNGIILELEENAFKESGTLVSTVLVIIEN